MSAENSLYSIVELKTEDSFIWKRGSNCHGSTPTKHLAHYVQGFLLGCNSFTSNIQVKYVEELEHGCESNSRHQEVLGDLVTIVSYSGRWT